MQRPPPPPPGDGDGVSTSCSSSSSSKKKPRTATMKPIAAAHLAALRGRYELVGRRGKGSFGKVWEAIHLVTGHRVAIKIICCTPKPIPKDKVAKNMQQQQQHQNKLISKVEREIRLMRLLRHHPNIARFYQAIRAGTTYYIVMELAESGQLHDHVVVRDMLPEDEARRIFRQLVAGVAYCHRNMVVHRDLKMENVLLDSRRNVKIVDFGFSKRWSYDKMQTKSCGSRAYAAPELREGREYMGPEVDVWSCGVILYAMLCGRLPFDGAGNMSHLSRRIRQGNYRRLPPWVSDDARDLIADMLVVRPEKRATITDVRAHRWLRVTGEDDHVPPYLTMDPPDAAVLQAIASMNIDAAAVELLATRHGFDIGDTASNHQQLLELEESDSEAAVAYQLVLSNQYDAATRYYQQLSVALPPPPHAGQQWVLGVGGLGGELVLHECPRETMRRIARALGELGVVFVYHSHCHRIVCCAAHHSSDGEGGGVLDNLSAAVLFDIQLAKEAGAATVVEEEEGIMPPAPSYVVLPTRTSGPQLHYLNICSQLASKLRSSHQLRKSIDYVQGQANAAPVLIPAAGPLRLDLGL